MWITMQSLEHHDYDSSCPENHGVHFKLDCLRDFVENCSFPFLMSMCIDLDHKGSSVARKRIGGILIIAQTKTCSSNALPLSLSCKFPRLRHRLAGGELALH
ncbi:hypothetical protein VTN96DRAFT_9871 [Rasamsonia emersonii]